MKSFDRKEFAANLARESDQKKRRVMLDAARKTEEYQEAEVEHGGQQKEYRTEQEDLATTRETLRGGASREIILEGVRDFLELLLRKYPQVNREGKLNYYLSGSLAVILLAQSERFALLDESKIPDIVLREERNVHREARQHFERFVRKVGDLDYIPLHEYKELPREERLAKGGGINIADLSFRARNVFRIAEEQSVIGGDPVGEKGMPHRVVRVTVGAHDVYMTDPKDMLAYKVVHLGQRFDNEEKTGALVSDFHALAKGLEILYSRDELVKTAHETIFAYVPESPHSTFIPYYHPRFKGGLKKFFDDIVAVDADASYLSEIQYGKERSIGFLKILHRLQTPEAKRAAIAFINVHRSFIDQWEVNPLSEKEKLMRPLHPPLLDLLMKVDERHIQEELQNLGGLLELRVQPWQLEDILSSSFAADSAQRRGLFQGLLRAREALPDERFEELRYALKQAVERFSYDPIALKSTKVKPEEWPIRVATVFEHFGIT